MKTIHKFPLLFQQEQQIQIQPNAKPLAVQMQNGIPCLWAEVEAGEDPVTTTVRVLGTGFPVYERWEYMGTVIDGEFVWHFYKVTKP
jgi:hypothetical protein